MLGICREWHQDGCKSLPRRVDRTVRMHKTAIERNPQRIQNYKIPWPEGSKLKENLGLDRSCCSFWRLWFDLVEILGEAGEKMREVGGNMAPSWAPDSSIYYRLDGRSFCKLRGSSDTATRLHCCIA